LSPQTALAAEALLRRPCHTAHCAHCPLTRRWVAHTTTPNLPEQCRTWPRSAAALRRCVAVRAGRANTAKQLPSGATARTDSAQGSRPLVRCAAAAARACRAVSAAWECSQGDTGPWRPAWCFARIRTHRLHTPRTIWVKARAAAIYL